MRYRDVSRHITTKAFWGGVATGMRSPAGRRGFSAAYRRSVWPSAIGAFGLLTWVRHSRTIAGLPRLSSGTELELCMVGALLATGIMLVARWSWGRWQRKRED